MDEQRCSEEVLRERETALGLAGNYLGQVGDISGEKGTITGPHCYAEKPLRHCQGTRISFEVRCISLISHESSEDCPKLFLLLQKYI